MTKDGRPSRLSDIRLFAGYAHSYLEGFEEVKAFARRLAWFLNGENFSVGAHTHMYVFFSPTTPIGTAISVESGMDWWFRYTYVGASRELVHTPEVSRLLEEGVVAALKANRPDKFSLIDRAAAEVREHGGALRFLLKTEETKAHLYEVAVTIGEWKREPTAVRVLRTDKLTGEMSEPPPLEVMMAEDARSHVALALSIPTSEYQMVLVRPPTSKMVKWMGLVSAT